ncbi:MAG: S8 family serine peptidase [Pseudomonadota bacterium]
MEFSGQIAQPGLESLLSIGGAEGRVSELSPAEEIIRTQPKAAAWKEKDYRIMLKSERFTPAQKRMRTKMDSGPEKERQARENKTRRYMLVQLNDIPTKEEIRRLKSSGINLLSYIPNYAWIASVSGEGETVLSTSPLIRWSGELPVKNKMSKELSQKAIPSWSDNGDGTARVIIRFHEDVPLSEARQLVEKRGGKIHQELRLTNSLIVSVMKSAIGAWAAEETVQGIESVPPPPKEFNDSSRIAIGADICWFSPYDLTGSGVTIGVWDSGHVDAGHDDFESRVSYGDVSSLGISDHATHVAGTVGGCGVLSENMGGTPFQWAGMAPDCFLLSYDWKESTLEHYNGINQYAVDVSQNSWGYVVGYDPETGRDYGNRDFFGDYTTITAEYDSIVRGNYGKRVAIVFAAGNDRSDLNPTTGVADPLMAGGYKCVPPPGTAKNVITVGAVNSEDFSMTTFSNWGPVDDGRIKPEIVAPGAQKSEDHGVTSCLPGDIYGVCQGTSMAAPAVSGGIALITEEFRRIYGGNPLPSTLKGILVHSAIDLGNPGPDYSYGYGLIDLPAGLNIVRDLGIIESAISSQTEEHVFEIKVAEGQEELKITLAWDDAPKTAVSGADLVNDLDLKLVSPAGVEYYPFILDGENPAVPSVRGTDRINPVEQVCIANPDAGTWQVRVTGFIIPVPPQNYSLIGESVGISSLGLSRIMTVYNDGESRLDISSVSHEKNWLSVSTDAESIEPGCSKEIAVAASNVGLQGGTYYDAIRIVSNDPDEGTYTIPVSFIVSGDVNDTTPPSISTVLSSVGVDMDGEYRSDSQVVIAATEFNGEVGLTGAVTITSSVDDPGIGNQPLTDSSDGTYTYLWDTRGRKPGNYQVQVVLADRGGNQSPAGSLTIALFLLDGDGDGISDDWETEHGLDPKESSDASLDPDKDELSNQQEYQSRTNPLNSDTDDDLMPDGWEVGHGLNALDPCDSLEDTDQDGSTNLEEYQNGTDPGVADFYPAGDQDRDKDVDGSDLAAFIAAYQAGNADLNEDGQTNGNDLAAFAQDFGK